MFNESGIKPDKKRVESIVNLKKPNNKKLITYGYGYNYLCEGIHTKLTDFQFS